MGEIRYRSEEAEPATEEKTEQRIKRGAKRFGYLVAAAINGVLLWVAHQLLDWEWPSFLTLEFDDVLPIITVSFMASIAANLVYAWKDDWPIKPIGEAITTVIGFVIALRIWQVFPFEFTGEDWSWLIRLALIVTMVGSTLGVISQVVSLAKGPPRSA